MGGGKHIVASVRKYGRDAHKKEILQIVETAEELKALEQSVVNDELLHNPQCLNIALGGARRLFDFTRKDIRTV